MYTKKFRKKPVIVECMRFAGNISLVSEWCPVKERGEDGSWFTIETPDGDMRCSLGDWIIKDSNGEFRPCKSDIFIKTYEEIPDNE